MKTKCYVLSLQVINFELEKATVIDSYHNYGEMETLLQHFAKKYPDQTMLTRLDLTCQIGVSFQ